eukprot:450075-Pleurochrysis_carterae.AAC.11
MKFLKCQRRPCRLDISGAAPRTVDVQVPVVAAAPAPAQPSNNAPRATIPDLTVSGTDFSRPISAQPRPAPHRAGARTGFVIVRRTHCTGRGVDDLRPTRPAKL